MKVIERKIKKFILENPRQRSITGTREIDSGNMKDYHKKEKFGYEYI